MNSSFLKGPASDRLTPLDAVYRAMDMASLLAGAVARSDTHEADERAARLRSHLVKYICDVPAVPAAPHAQDVDLGALAGWLDSQALMWEVNGVPADDEDMRAVRKWAEMVRRVSEPADHVAAELAAASRQLPQAIPHGTCRRS
jgi:hypothetical protein